MDYKSFWVSAPDIFKVLWLYVAGIISLLLMYFLLTEVDQGIDVLIQTGEKISSGVASVIAAILWAYVVWYSCRLLAFAKKDKDAGVSEYLLEIMPQLLAFNCFVCIQVSIFSLPTFSGLPFEKLLILVLLHNVYYFILNQWFAHGKSWAMVASLVCIAAALAKYGYLAFSQVNKMGTYKQHIFWLPLLGAALFIIETLAVRLFTWHKTKIIKSGKSSTEDTRSYPQIIAKYFRKEFAVSEGKDIAIFIYVSVFAGIFYCAAIFSIAFAGKMGPMASVMLALAVLTGFCNFVSYFSIRLKWNLFLTVLIVAIIVGKFHDPYEVRTVEPIGKSFYKNRPDEKTFLYRWIKKREHFIDKRAAEGKKFDAYIVISDGGASRAGNWVCSVLSSLQDSSAARDPNDVFSDHLLAIAGASGGTVGNSAFYSMLRARQEGLLKGPFSAHAATFFGSDFLTFTLARLGGLDLLRHILPIRGIMDRSGALETVLATGSDDPIINTQLDRPLSQVLDTSGALPALFITTTRVQDGMPCILGSTQLPPNSQRKDVTKLLDTMNKDIRFATAVILSSRFPYISPAGSIRQQYFVDGGYVDNAGSGIMLDFVQGIYDLTQERMDTASPTARTFEKMWKHVNLHMIHIYNSPMYKAEFDRINPLANDLVNPVMTLAGLQGSSTHIYTANLRHYFVLFNHDTASAIIKYSLYDPTKTDEEGYPMSWAISGYQLERMHRRLAAVNVKQKSEFWFLGQ